MSTPPPPPGSSPPGDQRKKVRQSAPKVVVRIPSVDRFRSHYLKDISEGGLFVKAEKVLPVGALLSLELWPPGWDQALEISARVTRSTDLKTAAEEGKPCGMAVQFVTVPSDVDLVLKALVEEHTQVELDAKGGETMDSQIEAMVTELAAAREKIGALDSALIEAKGQAEAFNEQIRRLEKDEADARTTSARMADEKVELERKLRDALTKYETARSDIEDQTRRFKEATAKAGDTAKAKEQQLETVRTELEELARRQKEATAKSSEQARAKEQQLEAVRSEIEELKRRHAEANTKAAEQARAKDQQLEATRSEMAELTSRLKDSGQKATDERKARDQQLEAAKAEVEQLTRKLDKERAEVQSQRERADRLAADLGKRESRETNLKKLLNKVSAPTPAPKADLPFSSGESSDEVVVFSPAVAAADKAPSESESDIDLDLDDLDVSAEVDVTADVELDEAPPEAGEDPLVEEQDLDLSLDQAEPEGFPEFNAALRSRTRIVISDAGGKHKPKAPEEAEILSLLSASPTFSTLLSQLEGKMSEDKLRRTLFNLFGKALLEVRT